MLADTPSGTTAQPSAGDTLCADLTLSRLHTWAANRSAGGSQRPFFLATGFQSPRLPWSYPESVAKTRYPAGAEAISVAKLQEAPAASAEEDLEWFRPVEIDQYSDVMVTHDKPMSVANQKRVRFAYYAGAKASTRSMRVFAEAACVSLLSGAGITHVDDQVARLLAGLKTAAVEDDTAVVLTADHAQVCTRAATVWSRR